jgi:exosome complex RNA-binding protein Csl4
MENVNSTSSKKRSTTAVHKGVATRTRNDLTKQLKADLKATKAALRSSSVAARAELKLARAAAKAEIAVLRDQLSAAIKREQALIKISEQKAKMMWKAGEEWEKQQIAKMRKAFR